MQENIPYFLLSISLSAGRNILSKKTAETVKAPASFFFSQSVLFLSAALLLLCFNPKAVSAFTLSAFVYGCIYSVLLVLSQWMFTFALKKGNTSVCTIVYSLGFILPTISGTLFWNEAFTIANFIGLLMALAVILLTLKKENHEQPNQHTYVPYILIAMIASGGLGIIQKLQRSSIETAQKSTFLIIAFTLAFLCSFLTFLRYNKKRKIYASNSFYPALTGICFGGANLCNTVLAARMNSAVFFPLQNISVILLSTLMSIIIFKEKLTLKTVITILLGIATVTVFSI